MSNKNKTAAEVIADICDDTSIIKDVGHAMNKTPEEYAKEILGDKNPYALKLAKRLEASDGDKALHQDAAQCLRDGCDYLRNIAESILKFAKKTGYWQFIKYDCACCSVCGKLEWAPFDTTAQAVEEWKELDTYCPHCGAKMEYKKPRVRR